jgi:DNA-binding GntR family transcriptional regulator
MRESFQMRAIFEKAAVSLAIKTASDSELEDILDLAMKFPEASQSSKVSEFNELNNIFHMSIVRATHNSLLIDMCEGIMENLSRILMIDCKQLEFLDEKKEHIKIAQALLERDIKKSDELITEHIAQFQARVYANEREMV